MLTTEPIACPNCGSPAFLVLWQPVDEAPDAVPPKRSSKGRPKAKSSSASSPKRAAYNAFMAEQLHAGASMAEAHRAWRARNGKPPAEIKESVNG